MIVKRKLKRVPAWGAFLIWTIVSTAAYALAGLLFHFPSGFPPNNGARFNDSALVVGALLGGFTGLGIGSLQALLLRQYFSGTGRWVAAVAVSLSLTHAIGDALPDPIALPVVQIIGGLLLGIGQWLVLRTHRLNALVWIAATAIAWFAGLTLGLAVMKQVASDWQTQHVVAGLVTGLILSGATGVLLIQLVSNTSPEMKTV